MDRYEVCKESSLNKAIENIATLELQLESANAIIEHQRKTIIILEGFNKERDE